MGEINRISKSNKSKQVGILIVYSMKDPLAKSTTFVIYTVNIWQEKKTSYFKKSRENFSLCACFSQNN